ncbi:hypothetical protein V1478_005774 [Vespula squamosa]|uniref:Uncharacterized protein n=1 Tax=Vespula squamosa TaxID=30214 RepID=A0ABD2B9S1_VESSQ
MKEVGGYLFSRRVNHRIAWAVLEIIRKRSVKGSGQIFNAFNFLSQYMFNFVCLQLLSEIFMGITINQLITLS